MHKSYQISKSWLLLLLLLIFTYSFPHSLVGKESTCNAGDPGLIPRLGRSTGEEIGYPLQYSWASLVAQLVKNLPAKWRPGFSPWVGKIPWKRERLSLPGFWPGEFHWLYSPWGHKELDMAEWLSFSLSFKLEGIAKFQVKLDETQFISVNQLCLKLWDHIDCSMPGLLLHHQFSEFVMSQVAKVLEFHLQHQSFQWIFRTYFL